MCAVRSVSTRACVLACLSSNDGDGDDVVILVVGQSIRRVTRVSPRLANYASAMFSRDAISDRDAPSYRECRRVWREIVGTR